MQVAALLFPVTLLLVSCASQPQRPAGQIEVLATSRGQPLEGAACTVQTLSGNWSVQTPGIVNVGEPNGDLRVVCNHATHRASEVWIRAPGGAYAPGGTRVGVGVGGGFGGYRSGGVSLGFGFPLATGRPRYPSQVVVEMTPLQANP